MAMSLEDRAALSALEVRLKTILPEQYQDCYQDVQPVSMGSAGLKYGSDGKVAWNEMWATLPSLPYFSPAVPSYRYVFVCLIVRKIVRA